MEELVKIRQLTKKFNKKVALNAITLTLSKGKIIGILGENGAGKTTLLKILAGLLQKDAGEVTIKGNPISFDTHQYVAYLPDESFLPNWMKIQDAIVYYHDLYNDFDTQKAHILCKQLNLSLEVPIATLSKGYKERVVIMLTFARHTHLYLLDEPIGGIDPIAKELILKTILSHVDEHATVLLSTHLVKDVETILDEIIFISEGKIIKHESCDKVREKLNLSIEEYYKEVMNHD